MQAILKLTHSFFHYDWVCLGYLTPLAKHCRRNSISPSLAALDQAIEKLSQALPNLKQDIVDACAHTVLIDNTVTLAEAELLRTIVVALNCPLPPFLGSPFKPEVIASQP